MEPEYLDKLHGIMQGVYGNKFTLDVDTFKDKMINDTQYRDKIYGIMQGVYGDKFTLDPKTFYNKVLESSKKKSQSEIGSQTTQRGSGSGSSLFGNQEEGDFSFSNVKKQLNQQIGISDEKTRQRKAPLRNLESWEDETLLPSTRLKKYYEENPIEDDVLSAEEYSNLTDDERLAYNLESAKKIKQKKAPEDLLRLVDIEERGLYRNENLSEVESRKYKSKLESERKLNKISSAEELAGYDDANLLIDYYNDNIDKIKSDSSYSSKLEAVSKFKKELEKKYGPGFDVTQLSPEDADLYNQLSNMVVSSEDQILDDYVNALRKDPKYGEKVEKYDKYKKDLDSIPDSEKYTFIDNNGILRKGIKESHGSQYTAEKERFMRDLENEAISFRSKSKKLGVPQVKYNKPFDNYFADVQPIYGELNDIYGKLETIKSDVSSGKITDVAKAQEEFNKLVDQFRQKEQSAKTIRESYNISEDDLRNYNNLLDEESEKYNLLESNFRKRPLLEETDYSAKLKSEKRYAEMQEGNTMATALIAAENLGYSAANQLVFESLKSFKPIGEAMNMGQEDYDWSDKLYDYISAVQKASFANMGYKKPQDLTGQDMPIYTDYQSDLPGLFDSKQEAPLPLSAGIMLNLANGLGSAAAFMAPVGLASKTIKGAGMASKIGRQVLSKGSWFLQMESANYERNLNAGMNSDDASELSILQTIQDIAAESVFNEAAIFTKARPAGFMSALRAGATKREAFKAGLRWAGKTGKDVAESAVKESFEEGMGQFSQDLGATEANLLYNTGLDKFNDVFKAKSYANSMAVGALVGGFLSFTNAAKPMSPTTMNAMSFMGTNAKEILDQLAILQNKGEIDQKKYDLIKSQLESLSKSSEVAQSTPGFSELSKSDQDALISTIHQRNQVAQNVKDIGFETRQAKSMMNLLNQRIQNIIDGKRSTDEGSPIFRTYMDANLAEMGVAVVDINDDGGFNLMVAPGLSEEERSEVTKKATSYLSDKIKNDAIVAAKFKPKKDAIQESSTEEVLPRQQGETTETGGQPQGMGPSIQGEEVTQETEAQRKERIAKEAAAGAAEVVTGLNIPNALAASVFPVVGEVEAQMEKGEFVNDEKSTEAQDKLYELLADIDSREDLTPEQKQQMSAVIENRIQKIQDYDYRTRTETRTTTQTVATGVSPKTQKQNERAAIPVRTVAEEGVDVTYDGRRGKVELRDGQYVFIPAKTGAVQGKPVVIGEAAQVNSGSRFAGVENPTKGPNAVVANITLPNGSTLSVLNDDLSVDIGLEIAKQEVGLAPQALFDTVFDEVVTENKVEVPYLRETKPAQEQAATTEQATDQVTEQATPQATPQVESNEFTGTSKRDLELKRKYAKDYQKRRVLEQATKAASVLKGKTKIVLHENSDDYKNAMNNLTGTAPWDREAGSFNYSEDGKFQEIHIDLSRANDATVFHEAAHAVLFNEFGDNAKLFQQFKDKLKPLLANSTVAELENFANSANYVAQGVTAEEFLVEFASQMASQGKSMPKSTLQKIAQLINDFISTITGGKLKPFQNTADTAQVIDFFNSMLNSFASGQSIQSLMDSKGLVGSGKVNGNVKSKQSINTKLPEQQERTSNFSKVKEIKLSEINDKTGVLTGSDRLTTALLKFPDGSTMVLKGGIFYPSETGLVWASTDISGATQLANKINEVIKQQGEAWLFPVNNSYGSQYSNYTFFEVGMKHLQYAVKTKAVNKDEIINKINQFKNRKNYLKSFKKGYKPKAFTQSLANKNLQQIYDLIHEDFIPENATYDGRKEFVKTFFGGKDTKSRVFKNVPNTSELIAMTTEPVNSDVRDFTTSSAIKITGKVTPRETSKENDGELFHSSYPAILESSGNVESYVLDGTYNIEEVFPEFKNAAGKVVNWESVKKKIAKTGKEATYKNYKNTIISSQGSIPRAAKIKSKSQIGKYDALPGAPKDGPIKDLVNVAEKYAKENKINYTRQAEYVKIDEEFSKRLAVAYEEMKDDPNNPQVKKAYAELIKQTKAQYDALIKAGYEFNFYDSDTDPYDGNPMEAMRDLRNNKKMAIYGTYAGYGESGITNKDLKRNPMLASTGLKWSDQNGVLKDVTANDLFRAVHDAFGHGLEGAGFRARGEENAWQAHVRLFTGEAIKAITSETRGQNSWLNYGPYGEKNRTAKIEDTVFADQKIGLMPAWTWTENVAPAMPEIKSKSRVSNLKELSTVEETAKAIESKFDPDYKNNIIDQLSSFDKQIEENKFPSALEVAEKVLPRSIFNRYKSLYELAARNNINVSNQRLPYGMVAAWAYNNIQLNKDIAKRDIHSYEEFAEVLNHEIIHGLINYGVRNQYNLYVDLQSVANSVYNRYDSANDRVKEIIDYIKDTSLEFVEKDIFGATDEELESEKYREIGSLEELITYAFTNTEFAEFLSKIPASKEIKSKGSNIFEQLKNIIKSIIGGITKSPTALDEINDVLENYFDTSWNESNIKERNDLYNWGLKFNADENIFDEYNNDPQIISEAYHKAKEHGSNSELVEAVEELVSTGIKSKSQVSAIPKASSESKSIMSELETVSNKTGLAKENAVKRFIEKYGEKGVVAKQISDNFDKIQEQLGITKICNI